MGGKPAKVNTRDLPLPSFNIFLTCHFFLKKSRGQLSFHALNLTPVYRFISFPA